MSFGKRLKQSRKEKKLTQEQVANIIGIDDTTISKYENDNSEPDKLTLNKLCDLYGVTTDYLYGREEQGKINNIEGLDKRIIEGIIELPEEQKNAVMNLIDSMLKQREASKKAP